MTHDELLADVDSKILLMEHTIYPIYMQAFRAVVELHSPNQSGLCEWCTCRDCDHMVSYPCKTIQTIEKVLA